MSGKPVPSNGEWLEWSHDQTVHQRWAIWGRSIQERAIQMLKIKGGWVCRRLRDNTKKEGLFLQNLVSDAVSRLTTASKFEGSYYIKSVRIFYYACYTTSKIYWNERHSKQILVYFLDCKGLKFIFFIPTVFLQSSSEMVLHIINLYGCQVCKLHKISKGREYWLEFLPFY